MLDVAAMKHIAYVFDALIYYMRSGTDAAAAVSMYGGWKLHRTTLLSGG